MDEAFADYLTGMAALRKRVADDVRRKLGCGMGSPATSSPPKRVRGVSKTRLNDGSKA